MQNIIILEAQYDIQESCLKTKRKHEKSCFADFNPAKFEKAIQTDEDFTDIFYFKEKSVSFAQKISEVEKILSNNDIDFNNFKTESHSDPKSSTLVSYDVDSEDNSDEEDGNGKNVGSVVLPTKVQNSSQKYR